MTVTETPLTNGTIALSASTYSVGEAGPTVTITATRTGGSTGVVGISYATSNGSATAGSDYTTASGALSWADGDTANKTFTVSITDDTVYEGSETFNVTLSAPTGGAALGSPSTAVVTIIENDTPPTVAFQSASSSGSEGTTPASFTVVLSGQTVSVVTINYATSNGTATAGSDYTTKSGTLTFPALTTTGSITVAIIDDLVVDPNENFTINLNTPVNASLGGQTSHTYTIIDNESTNGVIALSAATYSIGEGGGFVTITATRTSGSTSAVGISYATSNGSASSASDYTAASGTLSWADGDAADKTFTVNITDDSVYEGNETFNVTLSAPTGGATLGSPSTAIVTIIENDTPPTVAFQSASSSGSEAVTPATFTVVLSGQTVSVVTINYATSNGTATAGSDYTAKSGTLTFPALTTTGTITVAIINDVVIDSNENFTINLSVPVNASLGAPSTHTFTIIDNDGTPPAVPTGVSIQSIRSNSAVISWNTVTGATSYNIYRSTDNATWGSAIGGIGAPPYTDTTAPKSNTKYYWTVTSFNGSESTYAASASGRTALSLGYNMISAPYNTAGQIPVAVFGGWADWAWFWLSTGSASPDTNGNWIWPNSVTPGQGVLAWSYNDTTVVTASGSANPSQILVTLVPGWNLISNHQLTDMTGIGTNWLVDGASLTSKVADLTIDGALNWWDGSTYQTLLISGNPTIEPWKSYFILNATGVNHTLTIK